MFRSEKPITAVSQLIERITKEEYDEDDLSDLPQLIEAIRLQRSTGPTEAARAIRKKLKYGNPHRQVRALTILDDLIRNAGPGFQRSFADEMLLERLRIIATDSLTDTDVKNKCQKLYRQWAALYKNTEGLNSIANLYRQLPQKKRPVNKENSRVLRETEQIDADDEDESPRERKSSVSAAMASSSNRRSSGANASLPGYGGSPVSPKTSSGTSSGIFGSKSKDKNKKTKIFNLEKEKPQMQNVISQAAVESTNLMNALMHINRETERVSEHPEVRKRFEICKQLRRQTFRYCTLVMDEKYLGTLLHANDQLSDVLVLYEQLDRSFDYDSDSEDYEGGGTSTGNAFPTKGPASPPLTGSRRPTLSLEDVRPMQPPRPSVATTAPDGNKGKARYHNDPSEEAEEEDDEDDPFADRNAVSTPVYEKKGMNW